MKKTDARKFKIETQQQIRYTAIKLRKSGKTYVEIARILDIHYTAVIKWWRFYDVEKWLKKDYPKIVKKAIEENAEIHWFDETGLTSQSNYI